MVFIPRVISTIVCLWALLGGQGVAAETNAERFERGLPPNPPRMRSSKVESAYRRQVSPGATLTGYIAVSANNDAFSGYLSKTLSTGGGSLYTYTTSLSGALQVTLPLAATVVGGPYFAIQEVTPISSTYPYVGVAGGVDGDYFGPNLIGYAYLTGAVYAGPGTGPTVATEHGTSNGETSIWGFVPGTTTFEIRWTNADGTETAGQPYYKVDGSEYRYVGITGDLPYLESNLNSDATYTALTLSFLPL